MLDIAANRSLSDCRHALTSRETYVTHRRRTRLLGQTRSPL